jgi:hypothetical protein
VFGAFPSLLITASIIKSSNFAASAIIELPLHIHNTSEQETCGIVRRNFVQFGSSQQISHKGNILVMHERHTEFRHG